MINFKFFFIFEEEEKTRFKVTRKNYIYRANERAGFCCQKIFMY